MQDKAARRKAVNLSIDAGLLAEAKAAGVNLSATLEAALHEALTAHRFASWREQNRSALASYDRHVDRDGLWLDDERTW